MSRGTDPLLPTPAMAGKVRGHPYYAEYHGHPVEDLEKVVASLCVIFSKQWS